MGSASTITDPARGREEEEEEEEEEDFFAAFSWEIAVWETSAPPTDRRRSARGRWPQWIEVRGDEAVAAGAGGKIERRRVCEN